MVNGKTYGLAMRSHAMRLKAKSQVVNKKLNSILEQWYLGANLPAGSQPHSQQQPSYPAQASGKFTSSFFHPLLLPFVSEPLPLLYPALLTCASGTSHLFFHTFQHSVDSSQLLCLLEWCSQKQMQMQLMYLFTAKTRLSLFKTMGVAR